MFTTQIIVFLLELYCTLGIVFALLFVSVGITRIDANAKGSGVVFRLLMMPGAMTLWPLLARRWWCGEFAPPLENNAHRRTSEVK
jgi:hypothetical protein